MIPRPLLRPLAATGALAVFAAMWTGAAFVSGRLKTEALPGGGEGERLNVAITLDFPPESFHVTRAQDLGQLVRVEGPTLYLMNVRRADAAAFARHYWVARVEPWRPGA